MIIIFDSQVLCFCMLFQSSFIHSLKTTMISTIFNAFKSIPDMQFQLCMNLKLLLTLVAFIIKFFVCIISVLFQVMLHMTLIFTLITLDYLLLNHIIVCIRINYSFELKVENYICLTFF